MKFTKMHGCGNDYVFIDEFGGTIDGDREALARKMSDRKIGVGSDGVIFIKYCDDADFEMEMYNADGSRGEMCGNGVRCVAKYVYEKGMTNRKELAIKSCDRMIHLTLLTDEKEVVRRVQ